MSAFLNVSPIVIAGLFVNFFQILDIIGRFRYISIKFNPYTQILLDFLDDAGFEFGFKFVSEPKKFVYNPDSRGKLSFYDVTILVWNNCPLF